MGLAPLRVERAEGQPPRISGYASVFYDGTANTEYQLWEGVVERIMPGTFDRALQHDDVRALFNHDPSDVLGRTAAKTLRLSVDKFGLAYSVDLGDTQAARDVLEYIRRGDVTGSSFSFEVTDETEARENGKRVFEIRGVKLWDVGPVTFPAYTATTAEARDWFAGARERANERDNKELAARLASYQRRAQLVSLGV
jgi:HK97 family phage prohead protease